MVAVVVFEFGVMRCQPLRRALVASLTSIVQLTVQVKVVRLYLFH
ncbi:acetyltransferase [Vibrio cholerae]|nr:acetyltransferase [Vibrio cholerae]